MHNKETHKKRLYNQYSERLLFDAINGYKFKGNCLGYKDFISDLHNIHYINNIIKDRHKKENTIKVHSLFNRVIRLHNSFELSCLVKLVDEIVDDKNKKFLYHLFNVLGDGIFKVSLTDMDRVDIEKMLKDLGYSVYDIQQIFKRCYEAKIE